MKQNLSSPSIYHETAYFVCACVCACACVRACACARQGMAAVQHRRVHRKAYCMTAVMLRNMIQWTPVFITGLEISNEVLSRSSSQTTAQLTRKRGLASQIHNKINHFHVELLQ